MKIASLLCHKQRTVAVVDPDRHIFWPVGAMLPEKAREAATDMVRFLEWSFRGEPLSPKTAGIALSEGSLAAPIANPPVSDPIFDIPTLIVTISKSMTLLPGNTIATGTPAGVGIGFTRPKFLRDGDEVKCEVTGIGTIRNTLRFVCSRDASDKAKKAS